MQGRTSRLLGFGLLAGATAGLLALTSMTNAALAFGDDTAIILGAGGFPTPPPLYVDAIQQLYLDPNGFGNYTLEPLTTPEDGLFSPADFSLANVGGQVAQATEILNSAILQDTANGGHAVVVGYSESSTIAFLEISALQVTSDAPSASQLSFILLGDPSNPDGGLYERILPSPITTDPYPTDVYTQEYDGFADAPRYPFNVLSDLNALMGTIYDHTTYADLTSTQISSAIELPTTGGTTDYYMITTDSLPLLEPLRLLPGGNQLADLLQPDATVLVDLGYGSLTQGYDAGPANVPTAFGLFPDVSPSAISTALMNGFQQGIIDAANAGPSLPNLSSLSGIEDALYTFGLGSTPDPTLPEFLSEVQAFLSLGGSPALSADTVASPTSIVEALLGVAPTEPASLLSGFETAFDALAQFPGL